MVGIGSFPFGIAYFQGPFVSFRQVNNLQSADVSCFDMANVQLHFIGVPFVAKSQAYDDVETR